MTSVTSSSHFGSFNTISRKFYSNLFLLVLLGCFLSISNIASAAKPFTYWYVEGTLTVNLSATIWQGCTGVAETRANNPQQAVNWFSACAMDEYLPPGDTVAFFTKLPPAKPAASIANSDNFKAYRLNYLTTWTSNGATTMDWAWLGPAAKHFYECSDGKIYTGYRDSSSINCIDVEEKNLGKPKQCTPTNPINPATGNKYQIEPDYSAKSTGLSDFVRHYNSIKKYDVLRMGPNWRHTFYSHVIYYQGLPNDTLSFYRPDGRTFVYSNVSGIWQGDADSTTRVNNHFDALGELVGWEYTTESEQVERYDLSGKLISITSSAGLVQSLAYNIDGRLETVTGPYGHTLSFVHNSNDLLAAMTTDNGDVFAYEYDKNQNLLSVTYPDNTLRQYLYEDTEFPNALTGIIDQNSERYASWSYDTEGRAISSEHAGGQERATIVYNADGSSTLTTSNGDERRYYFDFLQGVYKTREIQGEPCASCSGNNAGTTYDANGFISSETDFNGNVTTYLNDARGRELSRIEAAGTSKTRTITTQWHPQYRLPTQITRQSVAGGKNAITIINYTDSTQPKLPTRITRSGFTPDGSAVSPRTINIQYTSDGRVSQIDGPRSDVSDITTMTYYPNEPVQGNNRGQLKVVSNALGQSVTYNSYDAHGQVLQMTDANGTVTDYVYDTRQRLTSETVTPTQGTTRTTTYTYDGVGQLLTTTTPIGITLTYTYDGARYLRSVTDNLGNHIEYDYDSKGNRTQSLTKDADGILVRLVDTTFDSRDRVSSINAAGSLTAVVYDAVGNLVSTTDSNFNTTTHNYDALNRLMQSVDALAGVTTYDYDTNDRVVTMTAPNNAQTSYVYDDLGNLLSETSPDRGLRSYSYNTAGNLVSLTDARGINVNYSYDALGRVTSIDYPGTAEDVSFIYDAESNCGLGVGRLCNIVDESGTTHYRYDAFGNVITQNKTELGIIYTTRYGYDAGDNVITMTYPDGRTVNINRDLISRVSAITATLNGGEQTIVSDVQYRADNLRISQIYGNNIDEVRTYDLQGRLLNHASSANISAPSGVPAGVTVSLTPSLSSPSPSATTISFAAQASDSSFYEYQFTLQGPSTSNVPQIVQPFGLSKTWSWSTSSVDNGDSIISVEMRLAGSPDGATRSASLSYTIGVGSVEAVTMSLSNVSPTVASITTQVTANATGGNGNAEYRFSLSGPSTGNVPAVMQDYGVGASWNWVSGASDAGTYTVSVDARNVGSTDDSEANATQAHVLDAPIKLSGLTLTTDLPSPQKAGATITYTAQASGGNVGVYEYNFGYYGPGDTAYVWTGYSASNTYTLTTTEADSVGGHFMYVRARNVGSTKVQEKTKFLIYSIKTSIEPVSALTITTDLPSPQKAGVTVTYTAQASGGNVGAYEYNFGYWGPGSSSYTWTGYSASSTYTLTTAEAGSVGRHNMYVRARNVGSTKTQEKTKSLGYTIQTSIEPVSALAFTTDSPSPQSAGVTITYTAQASGGNVGVYEYNFGHWGPGDTAYTWTGYGSSNIYTLSTTDPTSVGTHYVYVRARNQGSTKTQEKTKQLWYTITSPVATLDMNYRYVNFNIHVATDSFNKTEVMIMRSPRSDDYNYWLKSPSTNQQWQQLNNAAELGAYTPDTLVFVDADYLDVWYRNEPEAEAYRYQRIRAPKSQQQQPVRFIKTAAGNHNLATRSYNYDPNGNVTDITKTDGVHSYGYDALDRIIIDAMPNTDPTGLNYDANGNRLNDTQGLQSNNYGYSANSNQLDSVNGQAINRDAVGNTITDSSPVTGGTRTFEYNNANRLFKVYDSGSLVAQYTYNALGQRTRKVTPTGTTVYHYDLQGQLISETESDGRPIKDIIWQGIEPVAQIDVNGATDTITYLHTDHLATPRSGTDANGDVVWTWNSDAFGRTEASGSVVVNLRFPGQYYDSETQLHYNWNRYYDPRVGRYITSDPIGLGGGLNTFGYVYGNPLNTIDSNGLFGTPESIFRDVMNFDTDGGFSRRMKKVKSLCEITKKEGDCIVECQARTVAEGGLSMMLQPVAEGVVEDIGDAASRNTSSARGMMRRAGHVGTAIGVYDLFVGCILECNN